MIKDSLIENVLPSHYFNLGKQIQILKAFVVFYEKNGKGATYKQIASILGVDMSRVSTCLKFWNRTGLLLFDNHAYKPSSFLTSFYHALQLVNNNESWGIMREAISEAWFVTETVMKLQLKPKITENEFKKFLVIRSGIKNPGDSAFHSAEILIDLLTRTGTIKKDEQANYSINLESNVIRHMTVDDKTDLIQVRIKGELYAISSKEIEEFVTNNGKLISTIVQEVS